MESMARRQHRGREPHVLRSPVDGNAPAEAGEPRLPEPHPRSSTPRRRRTPARRSTSTCFRHRSRARSVRCRALKTTTQGPRSKGRAQRCTLALHERARVLHRRRTPLRNPRASPPFQSAPRPRRNRRTTRSRAPPKPARHVLELPTAGPRYPPRSVSQCGDDRDRCPPKGVRHGRVVSCPQTTPTMDGLFRADHRAPPHAVPQQAWCGPTHAGSGPHGQARRAQQSQSHQ